MSNEIYDNQGRSIGIKGSPGPGRGPMGATRTEPAPMGIPNPVAGIDPIYTQEPPPKSPVPRVDDLGLGEFQQFMTENSFEVFITLMHYMIHQQQIVEGEKMVWGPEKMALAAAPFVGFGNPSLWENAYRHSMRERILPMMLRWNRKGLKWQKKNPLPWLFLEYMAADFAMTDKGHENALAIEEILQDHDFQVTWGKKK